MRRPGDNAGMARNDSGDRLLPGLVFMSLLDGIRPLGILEWVSPVAPVVTQAAVGAGHWAAGRRQRALAAWASAAGFGLVAWGLGTEAPTRAEVEQYIEQQREDRLRKLGPKAPASTGRETFLTRGQWPDALDALGSSIRMVFGVRSGLRRPRRLTVLAIVDEAPLAVLYVLRVPRAVQRRRPRIAVGSALVVAGAVARLRAASAEPLRLQQARGYRAERSRAAEYRWLSRNPSAASTRPTMMTAVRFTPAASTCAAMSPRVPRRMASRSWLA